MGVPGRVVREVPRRGSARALALSRGGCRPAVQRVHPHGRAAPSRRRSAACSTTLIDPGPSEVAPAHVLSGWWRRVGAAVVDGDRHRHRRARCCSSPSRPRSRSASSPPTAPARRRLLDRAALAIACVTVAALLYAPAMMARTNGQTLGRMATGIRVVRASGEPIELRLRRAARGRRQGAAVRARRLDHVRHRAACSTSCGRCGTRRTARCTTSSSTRASCCDEQSGDQAALRPASDVARPASVQIDLVAARPDADQRDRHADEVRDEAR